MFQPVTTKQLGKIIGSMPSKACTLDILQTDRLKQVLEGCLPTITNIVNSLLNTGEFCKELKEALAKLPIIATKIVYYQNINQHIGSITVVKPA